MAQQEPRLRFTGDSGDSETIVLDQPRGTVGRREDNAYVLTDPHVSRVHAQFDVRGGRVFVADLGSSGGTTVNGEAVEGQRALEHGDEVSFGPVSATFIQDGDDRGEDVQTRVFTAPTVATGPDLSPRQQEVLEHIAEGMTNKEIAEQLGITERTVKAYAAEVYTKLDVSNRAAAVAEGIKHGMLNP